MHKSAFSRDKSAFRPTKLAFVFRRPLIQLRRLASFRQFLGPSIPPADTIFCALLFIGDALRRASPSAARQ
jgi:hypothetical protein